MLSEIGVPDHCQHFPYIIMMWGDKVATLYIDGRANYIIIIMFMDREPDEMLGEDGS